MSTETMTRTITADTGETVTVPALPVDDRAGDGYDWIDALEGTGWTVLPSWGAEGYDAGAWALIVLAVARTRDEGGELFGLGVYVEGDTRAHWYRTQAEHWEAITAEVFFHWTMEQADGPAVLPAGPAELPAAHRRPPEGIVS